MLLSRKSPQTIHLVTCLLWSHHRKAWVTEVQLDGGHKMGTGTGTDWPSAELTETQSCLWRHLQGEEGEWGMAGQSTNRCRRRLWTTRKQEALQLLGGECVPSYLHLPLAASLPTAGRGQHLRCPQHAVTPGSVGPRSGRWAVAAEWAAHHPPSPPVAGLKRASSAAPRGWRP